MYRARRRRGLLCAVLALALGHTAFVEASHLWASSARKPNGRQATYLTKMHPIGGSLMQWPSQGQAALVLGDGRPAVSPDQRPVPIASLAKVMTAYLILARHPLRAGQDGFTITVTPAQAQTEAEDTAAGQSVVAIRAGEQLTERQLLEALLISSANDLAQLLATDLAGSQTSFVADMNAEARALEMDDTTYTDTSGFDPGTVSTAADQLHVFQHAVRFAVFRQTVAMPSATLPVAGTVTNYNPLLADGYYGKTGSDSAAGGCLASFTQLRVSGRQTTALGVVMGQGQGQGHADAPRRRRAGGRAAGQLRRPATALSPTRSRPRENHE